MSERTVVPRIAHGNTYVHLSGKVLPTATLRPVGSSAHKVGRNEPCPCGSGMKFKKCCGMGA